MTVRIVGRVLLLVASFVVYQTNRVHANSVPDCMADCVANRTNCANQSGTIEHDCTGQVTEGVCDYQLTCHLPG